LEEAELNHVTNREDCGNFVRDNTFGMIVTYFDAKSRKIRRVALSVDGDVTLINVTCYRACKF